LTELPPQPASDSGEKDRLTYEAKAASALSRCDTATIGLRANPAFTYFVLQFNLVSRNRLNRWELGGAFRTFFTTERPNSPAFEELQRTVAQI